MRDRVRLLRPRGAGFVLLLPLVGYGYAHWEQSRALRRPGAMVAVVLAWLCLHAGTMWLNAVLDRDEGAVMFGTARDRAPSASAPTHWAVPSHLATSGHVALLLSVLLAVAAGTGPGLCAAGCAALSLAYSHPRTAWKAHPVLGPFVNVMGYGVLSPAAGFSVVSASVTARTVCVSLVFCCFVLTFYFLAQCFQADDDRARGYRTLVATHGPRVVLRVVRGLWWVGAVGVFLLSAVGHLPVVCTVAVVVVPWLVRAHDVTVPTVHDAHRTARQALVYGLVLLGLAWGDHAADATRFGDVTYARNAR